MGHHHVDGTLVVAKLKGGFLGGSIYRDVAIRTDDGGQRSLGTLLALHDLRHAMTPGVHGRFYFYDMVGTKGIHGFRPVGGRAHARFPARWLVMMSAIAAINLMTVLGWYLLEGGFAPTSAVLGAAAMAMAVVAVRTRCRAMSDYRRDEPRAPSVCELKACGARA